MPMDSGKSRWAVVGGGMLGLTLALRLRAQGKEVTLFESAPEVGGLAAAWQLGDIVWDRHYHVTLLSDSFVRTILSELGLEKDMRWVTTKTGCLANGKVYSVSNTVEFLKFPHLNFIDKFRLGATIFYASRKKDWKSLERISVKDWLSRWSGRRAFERFWLPLLRSKLGENYKLTSAAFIWTTLQRLYAARRTGLKTELFGYLPGGYARTLDSLARLLVEKGVILKTGTSIARIRGDAEGLVVNHSAGEDTFDRVVVTLAAPLAAKVCDNLPEHEKSRLESVLYQGIVCASLLLDRPLLGYYVTNLLDSGLPFTGVIEMTSMVDPKELGGNHLVYLPRYLPVDDPFFLKSDEEVRDEFLAGLKRVVPDFSSEQVKAFQVSRVRYVCPLSTINYSDRLPPQDSSVMGLHFVNSAHILNGTLNVNETIQLAETAAERFRDFK